MSSVAFISPNQFFQPALSTQSGLAGNGLFSDRLGQIVTDVDDIDQCIRVILTTHKGSQVHRPLFGSDLYLYVDWPISIATPHLTRAVIEAISAWEPRIRVKTVSYSFESSSHLRVQIQWEFVGASQAMMTSVVVKGGA